MSGWLILAIILCIIVFLPEILRAVILVVLISAAVIMTAISFIAKVFRL